eukprot:GEMP01064015.1.p1 GENE.GEMP01064015.1~~GEMP01064015.1.p1  ORF type:complete len:337 (+),score=59.83 GEMP01064015.1:291-1301(+)
MVYRTLSVSRPVGCLLGAFVLWIIGSSVGFMVMKRESIFDAPLFVGNVHDRNWDEVRGHPPGRDRRYEDDSDDLVDGIDNNDDDRREGVEMECPEDRSIRGIVNDDYCDCAVSGADEPLTAACSSSQHVTQFECPRRFAPTNEDDHHVQRRQRPQGKDMLHMSQVRDGVCDCCDGSDEQFGAEKCENRCEMVGPEEDAHIATEAAKRALPRTLLRCTKCPSSDGGPEGIWSYLTQAECLRTLRGNFEYCPFRTGDNVVQTMVETGADTVYSVLGRGPGQWEEKYKKVRLLPGDMCLSAQEWQVYVTFACGATTKLERAVESSTCVYDLLVMTPAAC